MASTKEGAAAVSRENRGRNPIFRCHMCEEAENMLAQRNIGWRPLFSYYPCCTLDLDQIGENDRDLVIEVSPICHDENV